jgi:predicted nucleic acid-binding protein
LVLDAVAGRMSALKQVLSLLDAESAKEPENDNAENLFTAAELFSLLQGKNQGSEEISLEDILWPEAGGKAAQTEPPPCGDEPAPAKAGVEICEQSEANFGWGAGGDAAPRPKNARTERISAVSAGTRFSTSPQGGGAAEPLSLVQGKTQGNGKNLVEQICPAFPSRVDSSNHLWQSQLVDLTGRKYANSGLRSQDTSSRTPGQGRARADHRDHAPWPRHCPTRAGGGFAAGRSGPGSRRDQGIAETHRENFPRRASIVAARRPQILMPLVIDASVCLSWALVDEQHPIADEAYAQMRTEEAYVPALWWFELRNALIMNERRRRLSEGDVSNFLRLVSDLRIQIDPLPTGADVLALSRTHRLTVYDSAYLELSRRKNLPLATLDEALMNAAKAEHVALIGA